MQDSITLVSKDGQKFQIEVKATENSSLLKGLISDFDESELSVPDVSGDILKKCIEYLTYYADKTAREIPRPLPSADLNDVCSPWDVEFINSFSMSALFDLVKAANYLDIKHLLHLSCAKIATYMKNKTAEEIRKTFNIENDLTEDDVKDYEEFNI